MVANSRGGCSASVKEVKIRKEMRERYNDDDDDDDETWEISGSRLVVAGAPAPGILFFGLKDLFRGLAGTGPPRIENGKNMEKRKFENIPHY